MDSNFIFFVMDSGEVIIFCLTGANVDKRDRRVWTVFAKVLYGKGFADRGIYQAGTL